jgi:hypothetical protein
LEDYLGDAVVRDFGHVDLDLWIKSVMEYVVGFYGKVEEKRDV